jgi:hypothetical protein
MSRIEINDAFAINAVQPKPMEARRFINCWGGEPNPPGSCANSDSVGPSFAGFVQEFVEPSAFMAKG